MNPVPIIFIVGPSGVGKSDIAKYVETELHYLHLDVDVKGNFKANRLQSEWHCLSREKERDPMPFAEVLQRRAVEADRSGVIVTFPSTRILTRELIDAARCVGIRTVILWGPRDLCRKAARERKNAPVLDERRYEKSNRQAFEIYGRVEFDGLRVVAFRSEGSRWSREDLMRRIMAQY